jgi:hypothetical protein
VTATSLTHDVLSRIADALRVGLTTDQIAQLLRQANCPPAVTPQNVESLTPAQSAALLKLLDAALTERSRA